MAKLFCTDIAMRVTTDAVQVLGGYGYVEDYPVERYMREAKVLQIVEGTNQIQRLVIGRHLAKGVRAARRYGGAVEELSDIDRQIVGLLATDGRMSYTDLGKATGLSTSAVHQRVRRLEQRGVISGYVRCRRRPRRSGCR